MIIPVTLGDRAYDIVLEAGCLRRAGEWLSLDRKVLIVTDSGVPASYAATVAAQCREAVTVTVPCGEESKSLARFEELCRTMLAHEFTRTDCVVAVGGGVVGDLAGFAAAGYMRGIDFYNIPTTVLSQVDSSVGGKVAVNLDGVKNIVGAFHQPKRVLIDPDTLQTLDVRQIANGLSEAVKMALTFDETLFALFETDDPIENIETVIARSLELKAAVVEKDETEQGLRKVLNFGHTIGHGIESVAGLGGLYHGECVALGMLPMCSDAVRVRLLNVLEKLGLPTALDYPFERVWEALCHDKKRQGDRYTVVYVDRVGTYRLETMAADTLKKRVEEALTR